MSLPSVMYGFQNMNDVLNNQTIHTIKNTLYTINFLQFK